MKLQVPFIQLPVSFDAEALASEIGSLGEEHWRPHPQGFAGNSMLPLVAVDGDAANEAFAGAMAPTPALLRCPRLMQVLASLGATIGRTRLMRLSGHAEVTRHADQGYYWAERVRVHVPIVTQPTVRFECGDTAINMAPGECWIFDTWRQHRVLNDATQSRVHLVVDTVGGEAFWDLVARGRPQPLPPAAARTPWVATLQPLLDHADAAFACETANVPEVMSPWELNTHLGLLLGDAVPHPNLVQVRHITLRFARAWQALWAQYGDSLQGRMHFDARLRQYMAEVSEPARPLMLNNQLRWLATLTVMVGKVAVRVGEATADSSAAAQRQLGDNA